MTAASPRLTVITPSYQQARFLRRCLDSVLEQRYPNLQHLVFDGGSTDGSVQILREYGDAFTWRSERDGGQAAAINEGLRAADGDVVAWLNSDDYYLPGAFDRALAALAAAPDAGMVLGRALMVDERGETLRPYPTHDFAHRELARKCYVCQPTVFVRRRVLDDVGLLNEALDVCFDYDWWLRITKRHRHVFCPHVLAASRQYGTTKTKGRRDRALVEAGYLMRHHFGRASWRWSAKWVVHRGAWLAAPASARRYRRRFDDRCAPSSYGRRLLATLR